LDLYYVCTCAFFVGVALAKLILSLQTWAVWNRGTKLGIGLAVLFLVCWGGIIAVFLIYLREMGPDWVDEPAFVGCLVAKGSHYATIGWILLLFYEIIFLCLMLIKGLQCCKTSKLDVNNSGLPPLRGVCPSS